MNINIKNIERFQYITHDSEKYSHSELAIKAINAGCKWVQIRIKNKNKDFIKEEILKVKKHLTPDHKVKIIINDYVDLAFETNADGVHLGKKDIHPDEARKILGSNAIIGATANSYEDIEYISNFEIDYIGLGPFRFTTTKEKLDKILGLEGYIEIMKKTKNANINIPIIAIGGIRFDDIQSIIDTGVYGVAVSGYVTFNNDFENAVKQFLQFFKN